MTPDRAGGGGEDFRPVLRYLVRQHPEIDIVIVHQSNGDNDFFSHKPEVEACERERVIAACEQIISGIRETEARERRRPRPGPGPQSCPGTKPAPSRGGNCVAR